MLRLFRSAFITTAIAASWLGMTALHELGHVLNAALSGGRVVGVELPPRGLGHTHVSPNPRPQFVTWGGACWGSLLGASTLLLGRGTEVSRWFCRFFAGTCLIANGVYLGLGHLLGDRSGADDAHELLRQGASVWQLMLFGLVTAASGLFIWHRLGPCLGLIQASRQGNAKALALLLALAGLCFGAGCVLPNG